MFTQKRVHKCSEQHYHNRQKVDRNNPKVHHLISGYKIWDIYMMGVFQPKRTDLGYIMNEP